MAAVQLPNGEKIQSRGEQSDPGGAAHGVQQQVGRLRIWLDDGAHGLQNERHAKDDVGIRIGGERGNNSRVQHSIRERRKSEEKSHERAGRADVEKGSCGADGRPDQDERAERAD